MFKTKAMKKILILLMLPALLSAQKIDSTISKLKCGKMTWEFTKVKEAGKPDFYYVYCSYQNMEYQSITDLASIFIARQHDVDSLASDLTGALKLLDQKQKARYERDKYTISVGVFGGSLLIYDKDSKYTTLTKPQAEKLIAWLKTVKFP